MGAEPDLVFHLAHLSRRKAQFAHHVCDATGHGAHAPCGEFVLPAGVSFTFAGYYENQIRAQSTLMIVVPLALVIIFLILYMQFKEVSSALLVDY